VVDEDIDNKELEKEPGNGKFEALKDFKLEIEQGGEIPKAKKGRPKTEKAIPPGPSQEDIKREIEEIADVIISMANTMCTSNGLSPLNPLQITILKTGLVGTALKYNLRLDDQPELILAGGALWIAADKYSEFKKLRKARHDQDGHREEGVGQDDLDQTPR
jgi:hypothetical protein